jgi:hypothetical protein
MSSVTQRRLFGVFAGAEPGLPVLLCRIFQGRERRALV